MVKTKKHTNNEESDKLQSNSQAQTNNYPNFCESIIRDYNLRGENELFSFITDLLNKNFENKKRVEKIKKLLLTG